MSGEFKFFLCLCGMCLLFPPLIGLVLGMAFVVLLWFFIYKVILGG